MADILIRGMAKMPGNCRECMFAGFGGMRNELNVCVFSGESQSLISHERMSKCPLLLLPEGHGRLVDEADFLKRLDEYAENVYGSKTDAESVIEAQRGNNLSDNEKYILEGLFEAREILEDRAETILEAEVKEDG